MKVLMLNYEYPPLGGGAANANKNILQIMEDENVQIDLITSSENRYKEENLEDNINIYKIDVNKHNAHHWTELEILRYFFKGILKARTLEKKQDYDLIHAWFGFPCGLMARILRKPYIVSLRGSDVPGYNERFTYHYIFLKPILKKVWDDAHEVIANSRGLKELAQETSDINIKIIPNGVDSNRFKHSIKNSYEKSLKLICVARLIPRKRINDILMAIRELDIQLYVVGDGEEESNLKEIASTNSLNNKVNFKGYLDNESLVGEYKSSDIFILPSLNEGMSNTMLEAMSSGLPIITTDVGGTDELIDGNGVIVDKKSPKQIKEAILMYDQNREKLEKHGNRSREISEKYDWNNIVDNYLEIYEEIFQNSKFY